MSNKIFRPLVLGLLTLTLALGASPSAFGAATITIFNNDAAGVGFNDTTVVAPVGGNPGTTLGAQRLNAFQSAANTWGATLNSSVTINIRAQWTALTCTATTAFLGTAGAIEIFRDFPGAPFTGTWYNESMAGKFQAVDPDPATPEINANFNVNLGQPGCLTGTFFYLGLDNNHGSNIDLVTVLIHEFGHGLGFQTFTNGTTGAYNSGFPSIYDRFLIDLSTGKSWLQMNNAERAASVVNTHKLAWDGPQVTADVPSVLAFGIPIVKINSPAGIAGNYDAGTASFGPPPTAGGVTGNLRLANDGTAPTSDGCEPFPAGFFTGQIAVIDRGTCTFKTKTLNAQNANAIGVIIVNNVAGSPAIGLGDDASIVTPITIPTVSLTQPDGNLIEAQLGGTVNGAIQLDMTVRAGADPFGKALLFSPNPFQGGQSLSHWDTRAFPNQLMEPFFPSADLTHNVTPPSDLTFSVMSDIGWVPSTLPISIAKTSGDNQNTLLNQPFPIPFSVTVSPPVSGIIVTWTVNPNGSGASAAFPSTSSRFAVSTTNASGVATAPPLTANGQPGIYSMNATVPGAGTTTFALSNDPVPVPGAVCVGDTTQADFQGGVTNNTDVNTSPDNVILLNPANVDQQNQTLSISGIGISTTGWSGQTFVPSVTGQLAKADINLFCAGCTGTTPTVTVSVRNTAAGLPTGADLAAVTIPTSTSGAGGLFTFNFASPPTLNSATIYALVIRNASDPVPGTNAVIRSAADVYGGGNRLESPNSGGTWTPQVTDIGFITYMQTGNAPAGDFVSSLKDSNPPVPGTNIWSTMTWNATVPANTTLQFQVAGSTSFGGPFDFVGPDGTPGTFYTTSPADISQFSGSRYLKYKAFFTTTNGTATATLNDVTVCYNNPAGPAPTPTPTPTATPVGPTPTATATATATATPVGPTPTATPTATPTSITHAINISTRMRVQVGDNVGIGGFIITGTTSKNVIVRAIGPTLARYGIPDVLADPVLELHGPGSFATISNNNWRDDQEAEIQATGIPPTANFESAIVATLDPGAYTAIVRGNGNTSGVGLVEVYDLNQGVDSKLANLSTRAFVGAGSDIVIAGFFLSESNVEDKVIVRGIGPSLTAAGMPNPLADPTLELRDGNGTLLITNNDWQDDPMQASEISAAGLAPNHNLESAIAATLPPGLYTALLEGINDSTGIGVVEIYDLGQ